MGFDRLDNFFERFKHITPPDETIRKTVVGYIHTNFNKNITLKDVSVRNAVVYIKCQPTLKNSIFLKKNDLISHIKETTNTNIVDVR